MMCIAKSPAKLWNSFMYELASGAVSKFLAAFPEYIGTWATANRNNS